MTNFTNDLHESFLELWWKCKKFQKRLEVGNIIYFKLLSGSQIFKAINGILSCKVHMSSPSNLMWVINI